MRLLAALNQRGVAATVIALVAIAISLAVLMHRRWPRYGIEHETIRMAERALSLAPIGEGRAPLDALDAAALDAMSAAIASEAALHPGADTLPGAAPERIAAGVRFALEFIARRADPDPDAYLAWAEARGCRGRDFVPPTNLVRPDGGVLFDIYARAHELTFEAPMPEGMTPHEFVRAMLNATQTSHGGRAWARTLLTDPSSRFVEVAAADARSTPFQYSLLDRSALGDEYWYGAIGATSQPTLQCGRSLAEIISEHGGATVMRVMLTALSPGNRPIPFIVELYHDPRADQWNVRSLTLTNIKEPVPYAAY